MKYKGVLIVDLDDTLLCNKERGKVAFEKATDLCLLTDEEKMGKLKDFYQNIMTENKFT